MTKPETETAIERRVRDLLASLDTPLSTSALARARARILAKARAEAAEAEAQQGDPPTPRRRSSAR